MTAFTMPRYFPTMNCRRLIGFDNNVIAVLPSISSAMLVLDVQTAMSRLQIRMVARPQSLSILTSSPNVKKGRNVLITSMTSATTSIRMKTGCRIASLVVARAMMPARVV